MRSITRGRDVPNAAWQARADGGWSGDLRDVAIRAWSEDHEIAALYAVQDGEAYIWINLKHANEPALSWQAWLWCRYGAAYCPPFDVLPASVLAAFREPDSAQEA